MAASGAWVGTIGACGGEGIATRAELLRPGFNGAGGLSPETLAGADAGAGTAALGLPAALLAGTGALAAVFFGAAGEAVFGDSPWSAGWLDLAAVFTVGGVALGAGWTFTAGLAIAWAGALVFFS